MASFIDKMTVNTAITDNTKLDLGHQHITTTNFMQLTPVLCKEMVPGERCDVNMMTFAKLQPLAVPTFGRANIKERAFFVPMRTIFRGWNDFITDTPHVYSGAKAGAAVNYPVVPTISNYDLASLFLANSQYMPGTLSAVTVAQNNPQPGNYDILGYYNGAATYRILSKDGKQCLKVLESLGYKIVFDERNTDVYSALPLLAVAKVYCDWYFPNQYVNTGGYVSIMGLLNYDGATSLQLTTPELLDILGWITYANYDADYFVNAWDNPVSPSNGVYSQFNLIDISTLGAGPQSFSNTDTYPFVGQAHAWNFGVNNSLSTNGTPVTSMDYRGSTSGSSVYTGNIGISVSDYQHKSLTALTDYMKRHQLVGARAMDRYLARFGKKLNSEQLNRCNYIGSKMIPMEIGEVISTSESVGSGMQGNALGNFVGKGQAFEKNFSFDWTTDEYGYLIVMTSLIPAAGIYQGLDRKVMHISKTDFWTPEFDNLGVQAISTRELYNNYSYMNLSTSASSYMGFNDTVFGFAPRYGEYKYAKDQLTGDFVLNSNQPAETNASENAWHLFRTFSDQSFYNTSTSTYSFGNLVHSRNFMSGLRDNDQYNRIFTYNPVSDPWTSSDLMVPDPVTMIYDFQMVSFAPMKPLYETYDFEDKGKKIEEEAGGVKLN